VFALMRIVCLIALNVQQAELQQTTPQAKPPKNNAMRLLSRRRKRKTSHAGIFLSTATRFGVSWLSRCAGKCPNSLSLSLLFAHFSALHNIHEAPHYAAVLKYLPACDASRLLRLESSRIALFWGDSACGIVRWRSACCMPSAI
jgi:hypothetical protein